MVIYWNNPAVPVCMFKTDQRIFETTKRGEEFPCMPVGLLRFHAEILVIDILFHMWTETQQLSACEYSS